MQSLSRLLEEAKVIKYGKRGFTLNNDINKKFLTLKKFNRK